VVTAVAVWAGRPSPDELLAARLERGWAPTTTATDEGDVILGHAACLGARANSAAGESLKNASDGTSMRRSGVVESEEDD